MMIAVGKALQRLIVPGAKKTIYARFLRSLQREVLCANPQDRSNRPVLKFKKGEALGKHEDRSQNLKGTFPTCNDYAKIGAS